MKLHERAILENQLNSYYLDHIVAFNGWPAFGAVQMVQSCSISGKALGGIVFRKYNASLNAPGTRGNLHTAPLFSMIVLSV